MHLPRTHAQRLNPVIGSDTDETLQNLISLLDGQSTLITDRSAGTKLEAESVVYLLQTIACALNFEASAHIAD